jgi:hypothetical protein
MLDAPQDSQFARPGQLPTNIGIDDTPILAAHLTSTIRGGVADLIAARASAVQKSHSTSAASCGNAISSSLCAIINAQSLSYGPWWCATATLALITSMNITLQA